MGAMENVLDLNPLHIMPEKETLMISSKFLTVGSQYKKELHIEKSYSVLIPETDELNRRDKTFTQEDYALQTDWKENRNGSFLSEAKI